jgi:hypothetical protein
MHIFLDTDFSTRHKPTLISSYYNTNFCFVLIQWHEPTYITFHVNVHYVTANTFVVGSAQTHI